MCDNVEWILTKLNVENGQIMSYAQQKTQHVFIKPRSCGIIDIDFKSANMTI